MRARDAKRPKRAFPREAWEREYPPTRSVQSVRSHAKRGNESTLAQLVPQLVPTRSVGTSAGRTGSANVYPRGEHNWLCDKMFRSSPVPELRLREPWASRYVSRFNGGVRWWHGPAAVWSGRLRRELGSVQLRLLLGKQHDATSRAAAGRWRPGMDNGEPSDRRGSRDGVAECGIPCPTVY